MYRLICSLSVIVTSLSLSGAQAQTTTGGAASATRGTDPAIPALADYADPKSWMCRPGTHDAVCSDDLDTLVTDGTTLRTIERHRPESSPAIDCFFVYPTTSLDPGRFSDMIPDREERRTVHGQAARLSAQCRLFVPIYHQFTTAALRDALKVSALRQQAPAFEFDLPYRDIAAAWASYLARDNHGRGVVLVGHSQGAVLLKRLIAEEIDGKPAQRLLVGAYLAGNLDLTRSSFRSVQPCAASDQTACVVAWSTYLEGDQDPPFFGASTSAGEALCTNPASPAGGRKLLKPHLPRPDGAPASDPPFIQPLGQLSAECVKTIHGNVLRVRIEPSDSAESLQRSLARFALAPGWGIHPIDISVVQGDMLDMIEAQAKSWHAPGRKPAPQSVE